LYTFFNWVTGAVILSRIPNIKPTFPCLDPEGLSPFIVVRLIQWRSSMISKFLVLTAVAVLFSAIALAILPPEKKATVTKEQSSRLNTLLEEQNQKIMDDEMRLQLDMAKFGALSHQVNEDVLSLNQDRSRRDELRRDLYALNTGRRSLSSQSPRQTNQNSPTAHP